MIRKHGSTNIGEIIFSVGRQLIAVLVIAAIGFSFMYFSHDVAMATYLGISYLIVIAAIILVMIADSYDRRLMLLLKMAKL